MRQLLLVLWLFVAFGCGAPAVALEEPVIHVVLYMGQSNVHGSEFSNLPSGLPLPAVRYWARVISGGWTDSAWHSLDQLSPTTAFSAELTMGQALNEVWPGKVAILRISRGGSTMAQWQPGQFFHTAATDTIAQARALLLAEFPGETQVAWHFVWEQGESEGISSDLSTVQAWSDGYATLKASLVTILGQSLRSIIVKTNSHISGHTFPGVIDAEQASVADGLVDMDDCLNADMLDGLHYASVWNNTKGQRIAAAIVEDYMGSLSTDLRTKLLDHARGRTAYTRPATVYFAAFVAGAEVTGNGYARKAVTNNATNFPAASSRAKSNGTVITFATATGGSWGTIDEIREYDASSGGNERSRHTLAAPQAIGSGATLQIAVGDYDITLGATGVATATANALLDHAWGGGDYTPLANTYGSYWLGNPLSGGSQLSASRVTIPNSSSRWAAASAGVIVTNADISLASEGTATYWAEHDASSAGNLVFAALLSAFPASGTIQAGRLRTLLT